MKKEKQKQKPKEFAVSPFKALKGVAVGRSEEPPAASPTKKPCASPTGKPAAPAAKKPAVPVKSRQELDDEALFFEAMAEVQHLHAAAAAPARVKEQAAQKSQRDAEDQQAFLQAVEALKMDVRFSDELPEEESPHRPPAVNRLRQLRRGTIRVDLELDLHGLTRDEALENLDRFVRAAYNRGQKGVLIITGKGNNSPGEPVLKAAVTGWLREHGKGMVAEFVAAPRELGGSGAIVVFFKEKKAQEQPEKAE